MPSYRDKNNTPFGESATTVPVGDGSGSKLLYSEKKGRYLGIESDIGKG